MTPVPNKVATKATAAEPPKSKIPANVRRPSDHQSAKEDVAGPTDVEFVHEGTTYVVEGGALDDAELMEYFTSQNFVGALMKMLGNQQWMEWKNRNRDEETGRVPASAAAKFLEFALKEVKRKNS